MRDISRLERNFDTCIVIAGFCILGLFIFLVVDSLENPYRKAEYLELCADDGFKPSECLYRWGVMR